MSHEKQHAAAPESYQPNGVQAEWIEVMPSRREAMSFAVSIFKGVDASTAELIIAAEAIHQFLIGNWVRDFPYKAFAAKGFCTHKESSFCSCGKHKMDGAGSSGNAAARSADAGKTA